MNLFYTIILVFISTPDLKKGDFEFGIQVENDQGTIYQEKSACHSRLNDLMGWYASFDDSVIALDDVQENGIFVSVKGDGYLIKGFCQKHERY